MPIASNSYFNDPAIGQAFASLGQLFAPPTAQDMAAYATAAATKQKAGMLAKLFASGASPSEQAALAGIQDYGATPLGFTTKLNMDNAATLRGQDMTAATSRYGYDLNARTELEKQQIADAGALQRTRLEETGRTSRELLAPVAAGATRFVPPALAQATGVAPTQVGTVSLAPGERATLPDGRTLEGAPKPLGVDEVKAIALQGFRRDGQVGDRELIGAILGDPKLEQVQGPNGPVFARAVDAVGQRPAVDAAKQGEAAGKIRHEIAQLPSYKNYAQAAPIYSSMLETAGRDSKASDLNLVYGLGKIMDPGSVVREGEMVLVQNTSSLPDWVQGAINRLNGGAALTPDTRAALMREAHSRMSSYESILGGDLDRYGGIVDRAGLRRDDVLPRLERAKPYERPAGTPAANGGQPSAPQVGAPVQVRTPEEAMRLPPGTSIRLPDGRLGVVPGREAPPAPRAPGASGAW